MRRAHRPARPFRGLSVAAIAAATALAGCGDRGGPPALVPGVTRPLARERAGRISDLRYDLRFRIPADVDERIRGRARIELRLEGGDGPLVLDFRAPPDDLRAVRVDGAPVEAELREGHVVVPGSALGEGSHSIELDFLAGDGALNRNDEYLYTLFVPDRASTAFPAFDQPDLKARFALELEVPEGWVAVANGARRPAGAPGRGDPGDGVSGSTTWRFAETEPIPTYLFAFAAGRFRVEEARRDGRTLRMYHRETDAEKVARNREAIFDLHARSLAWLEEYTGIDYPFGKLDFVLVPSFQYGGMEHPGAVLYRADRLLLDRAPTREEELGRASLIAHETTHMWFGNLVTMSWFSDVWMKEVFANFMAGKIVHPSFPEIDHDLRFLLGHLPDAYAVDRSAGANAIRQELGNLLDAGTLYGAIIYDKAPVVIRQMEELVGEDGLREGLRRYLEANAYGNASWPDLVAVLDERTEIDLEAWSRVWVGEPGRPVVSVEVAAGPGGALDSVVLRQRDPLRRGRTWPQPLRPVLAGPDSAAALPVVLDGPRAVVEAARGRPAPRFVLSDGAGIGYGRFELDPASRRWLVEHLPDVADPVHRAVAWLAIWDATLEGVIPPRMTTDVAMRTLAREPEDLLAERLVADLETLFWRLTPPEERRALAPRLESLLRDAIAGAGSAGRKAALFDGYASVALTDGAVDEVRAVWAGDREIEGLHLSERDRTELALELAVREVPGWRRIVDEEAARIENPDRKARFEFIRPAVDADPSVRDAFFRSLAEPSRRAHEPWVLTAVGYLHHPLRADAATEYIRPSLELLREIQRTGDIFFPRRWLDATLRGHRSAEAAGIVRAFLDAHPDYPEGLRGKILQAADLLFRTARLVPGSPGRRPDSLVVRDDLQELVDLQVERRGRALARRLHDADPAVRARAAFALASVQDPDAVPDLLRLLGAGDARVRRDAAFAVGQTADSAVTERLLDALAAEDDPEVRRLLVEALGKTGDRASLARLAGMALREWELAEAALAIARYGIRGVHHPAAVRRAVRLLGSPDPLVRRNAAYYFGRVEDTEAWSPWADSVRAALDGLARDDPAAMHLTRGLGRLRTAADRERLLRWLEAGADWRIRVNAARALSGRIGGRRISPVVVEALSDPSPHVGVAVAGALLPREDHSPGTLDVVEGWIDAHPGRTAVAGALLPVLAASGREGRIHRWLDEREGEPWARLAGIEALARTADDESLRRLRRAVRSRSPRLASGAAEALLTRWRALRGAVAPGPYFEIFAGALWRGDVGAAVHAARALADPTFRPMGSVQALVDAYGEMETPEDAEPMLAVLGALGNAGDTAAADLLREATEHRHPVVAGAAAAALGSLTGRAPAVASGGPPPSPPVEWERLRRLGPRPRLVLETERGALTVEVDAEEAPLTASTVLGLAEAGRYDGVPFHRVVPDFVIQGGDVSRGDGFGGPGFAIRSEFTRIGYDAATAGMASAGKDTEGSQYFVTHSMQPHLDGSYTAFGRVVDGREVVPRIVRGDRVVRARVEPTPGWSAGQPAASPER